MHTVIAVRAQVGAALRAVDRRRQSLVPRAVGAGGYWGLPRQHVDEVRVGGEAAGQGGVRRLVAVLVAAVRAPEDVLLGVRRSCGGMLTQKYYRPGMTTHTKKKTEATQ